MLKGYFIKAEKNMSLEDIKTKILYQKETSKKSICYNSIKTIVLDPSNFKKISKDVFKATPYLVQWASLLTVDEDGALNCLTINSKNDNIVFYTAGRTIPLYISYFQNKN